MYDLESFKTLVIQYLEFLVAEDFNYSYDMSDEIIITENLVSKKLIVVQNFSKKVEEDKLLKDFLINIISNINLRIIKQEDIYRTLNPQ